MRRTRGCLTVIVALLAASISAIAFGYWDQHTRDAEVPLGTWYGTFTSPGGNPGALLVVVTRKQLNQNATDQHYMGASNAVFFGGSARLCTTARAEERFTLSGLTDRLDAGFTIDFLPGSGGQRPPFVDGLHGERRQEALVMAGQFVPFSSAGDVIPPTGSVKPTAVTLAKGDSKHCAESCQALGAGH